MSANRTQPSMVVRIAAIVGAIAAALAGVLMPPDGAEPTDLPVYDPGEQALRDELLDRVAAAYEQGRADAFKSAMCISGGRP
ncbi:hypothetical protein [Caldimonas sp. KR1-144]|uniref:hypothetical protein n=1 Tax=Caldimonas sp. KR1-144 TaxID=3400911 RepID=UPI003C03CB7F